MIDVELRWVTGHDLWQLCIRRLRYALCVKASSLSRTDLHLADMTILASDAQSNGTPIVCVSIQYRVNIFCFGDEASAKNLAVLDQALAIEWVQQHIMDFGGDPVTSPILKS